MEYLKFIFYLGVIYITFDVLWSLFLWLLQELFNIRRKENLVYHLFKSISYYLLVSMTAATTLRYMSDTNDSLKQFFFTFVGLVVLYFYITSKLQKSRMKALIRSDVRAIKRMRYNSLYIFFSIALYITCLYFPVILETLVLDGLFIAIEQIFRYLLFRFIIGFMAIIFLANMLYRGFAMTRYLIMNIFGIKQKSTSSYRDMYGRATSYEETIEAEYQEVPNEEDEIADKEENRKLGRGE